MTRGALAANLVGAFWFVDLACPLAHETAPPHLNDDLSRPARSHGFILRSLPEMKALFQLVIFPRRLGLGRQQRYDNARRE